MKKYPSKDELLEYFEPNTDGTLTRIKRVRKGCEIGDVVTGTICNTGYRTLKFNGVLYQMHRLIWIIYNGDIPEGLMIDHIDRDKQNNRVTNLRLCTNSQNIMSCDVINSNTGVQGISQYETTSKSGIKYSYYRCSVTVHNKRYSKNFPNTLEGFENAKKLISELRLDLHGEFSCEL